MPSIIVSNNPNGLFLQPNQSVSQAPDGSGEGKLSYKCKWTQVASFVPTPLQPHPTFPTLLLFEFTTEREPGDLARFDLIYRGVLTGDPDSLRQLESNMAGTSEPIETHPRFGYPPSSPPVTPAELVSINLALQNNTTPSGLGDAATLLYQKKLRGVDSYLRIGYTFRRTYISTDIPTDVTPIGKTITSPDPEAPNLPTGSNWLYTGQSWRKSGGVVSISEDYQGSGLGQWDPDLYDYTTP